jgi:hypothetical protein
MPVSHCQFVPEIVQCAVNVFTYKTINKFDPSRGAIIPLRPFTFTRLLSKALKLMAGGTIEFRHKAIRKNGRPRN